MPTQRPQEHRPSDARCSFVHPLIRRCSIMSANGSLTTNLPLACLLLFVVTLTVQSNVQPKLSADAYSSASTSTLLPANSTITTMIYKHPLFGFDLSGASNYCRNGGTMVNSKCECKFPYTGIHCTDFACQHGLSTGPRYDPNSMFFNKKCICDADWSGELCHIPIANQCKERGQYLNGRCHCQGFYFGPACQYVGKCVHGKLREGLCHCDYGWEGDYCDSIVCHHGYKDKTNNSNSCVCPDRHTGFFCDECSIKEDSEVIPYPNCTKIFQPSRAKMSRTKTDQLIMERIFIISIVFTILIVFLGVIYAYRWGVKRAGPSDTEIQLQEIVKERQLLLKRAIFQQNNINNSYAGSNRLDHDLL